jgi:mRNA-degrading endonuclease HigB of HigAB toxin-antitoxin module
MNVISRRAIRAAQFAHPRCRSWLEEWWRIAKREQWASLRDVRRTYTSADQVGGYLIFDAPEGKRLIVGIRYASGNPPAGGTLFIKHFLTHDEYNRGIWKRG